MNDIDEFFNKLTVMPTGLATIAVSRDVFSPNNEYYAQLICRSCDRRFSWKKISQRYECPGCVAEISAKEASELCELYIDKIREIAVQSTKKRSWFSRLFKR